MRLFCLNEDMKFNIITLFPKQTKTMLDFSILKNAQEKDLISIDFHNLRDFGFGKFKQVDDTPYGGGSGMVLKPDVVLPAIESVKKSNPRAKVIALTPKGIRFNQAKAEELAKEKNLILVAGHYEGFDQRILDEVDEQISIGDFVITGGELAAAVVVDAVARLQAGVLADNSAHEESHSLKNDKGERLVEYPQYTRPEVYKDKKVPDVLLSGNHQKIADWREQQSKKTK